MKSILVPVGNSPDSYETLQYAVQFAAEFGAMVYVMEVLNLSTRAGDLANLKEKAVESLIKPIHEALNKTREQIDALEKTHRMRVKEMAGDETL